MLCATISLPQPLSPVTSTLASERATRSISSRRATMSGLWPINRTVAFGDDVTFGPAGASSPREAFDDVALIVGQIDEAGADFIAQPAGALRNAPDFDFSGERVAFEIEAQPSARAFFRVLARLHEHAGQADVEQAHRHRDGENGELSSLDFK